MKRFAWLVPLFLVITLPCFAEELPPLDFSKYEVGEFYKDMGLITWMSEDKREIEYIPYSTKVKRETELSLLQEIKEILKGR